MSPKYQIYGRNQVEVNTDPQRRCDNGCHSGFCWGAVFSLEEAEQSVASWKKLNPKRADYKYELIEENDDVQL